jgi:hypothetical protein
MEIVEVVETVQVVQIVEDAKDVEIVKVVRIAAESRSHSRIFVFCFLKSAIRNPKETRCRLHAAE